MIAVNAATLDRTPAEREAPDGHDRRARPLHTRAGSGARLASSFSSLAFPLHPLLDTS